MAKKIWVGMLATVAAFGLVLASCDNGTTGGDGGGSGGGGGGYTYGSWFTITLPSGTDTVQFRRDDMIGEAPDGRTVEIEIEGATPTSLTLASPGSSQWAKAPQTAATIRFRFRRSGFGVGGGTPQSPVSTIHFVWIGEFATGR